MLTYTDRQRDSQKFEEDAEDLFAGGLGDEAEREPLTET